MYTKCYRLNIELLFVRCVFRSFGFRGGFEGFIERNSFFFFCWVVLRCGSGKIIGKVVGGLRVKYNKGIIGLVFCLSVSFGFFFIFIF